MVHVSPTTLAGGRRLAGSAVALLLAVVLAAGVWPAASAATASVQQPAAAAPFLEPLSPPAGELDPAFDSDGLVTTGFNTSYPFDETGQDVAVQSDGKIVVAGWAGSDFGDDFALARYNPNGSLDAGFGAGGKVTTDFGWNDSARAVAIQSDGKIVAAGGADNGNDVDTSFALARFNSDGSLDATFDGDGKVTTNFGVDGFADDSAADVAIQSDDKIVVAGYADGSFAVVRYNSDGSLDTNFGTNGKVTTTFNSADQAYAVAIQGDGRIVAVGETFNGSNVDFALVRYDSAGALDNTFDGDGKVTTDLGSDDLAYDVAIQSDGRIVAVGETYTGGSVDFALVRYDSAGALDSSFGSGGVVTTDLGSDDLAHGVAIQSNGRIVVVGETYTGGSDMDFALVRYDNTGALDISFGSGGVVTTDFASAGDSALAVAIQSSGELVVAGFAGNGSNVDFAVARYHPDGSLDTSFDSVGKVTTAFNSSYTFLEFGWDVAIQSDGKIVAVGSADNSSGDSDFAVARYQSDGSLDASFGSGGRVTTAILGANDHAYAVAIQADGKIVVAGIASNGSNDDFAVARYHPDGSLDTSFGGGIVTTPIASQDVAHDVAIQSDGKIVVAGVADPSSNNDFALVRFDANGGLDTSFDNDGILTIDIMGTSDVAYAVAIQGDGKIVVAGQTWNGSDDDFALARIDSAGSLDTSFDGDGVVTTDITGSGDFAEAMVIQRGGKIVAAGVAAGDFAVARYHPDGSLDTSFNGTGTATAAISGFNDQAKGVAIQSDGKIVTAGYTGGGPDFALARFDNNGALDSSFDGDGMVTTDFGWYNVAQGMALQSDGKIVAVGSVDTGLSYDFALARYQVASSSSQSIADGGSATLEDVTVTNHSGAPCMLTVTEYPTPPGGAPGDNGEMPIHWQITTDCATYNFDLVFHYTDIELTFGNNVTEAHLEAYRSPTGNDNDYALVGGTVNPGANTVTVAGVTQLSWWGLVDSNPLAVTLAEFGAVQQGDAVLVSWETASELETRGFNLHRGVDPAGPDRQLNSALIPSQSPGSPAGFHYTWEDRADLVSGTTYFYWVEAVDIYGAATWHGPVSVDFSAPTAVQMAGLTVSSAPGLVFGWWTRLAALLAILTAIALAGRRRRSPRGR